MFSNFTLWLLQHHCYCRVQHITMFVTVIFQTSQDSSPYVLTVMCRFGVGYVKDRFSLGILNKHKRTEPIPLLDTSRLLSMKHLTSTSSIQYIPGLYLRLQRAITLKLIKTLSEFTVNLSHRDDDTASL